MPFGAPPASQIVVRLKQIKLAGFKSFVDPTAIELPGRLIGIVGPNGCGKSNIMDAVRWVLGETRAGELRGDSMQDVIFSGSDGRRAAARASVELLFENAGGRLGGPWAAYSELSVRRILSRDGQSIYQINHQGVRRRDVHDLFMGTGLGPRAYAIIGQGMIARILEARPEDLRGFLEEAAGISRYRERRRQTEERLADTRDNLSRVTDLLTELHERIARLEKQAIVAQRLRQLEADRLEKQQFLRILLREDASQQRAIAADFLATAQVEFDAATDSLKKFEDDLNRRREAHFELGEQVHARQGEYYQIGSELAAIEAEIRRVETARGEAAERLKAAQSRRDLALGAIERAEQDRAESEARIELADARVAALRKELGAVRETLDTAERAAWSLQQALETARLAMANSQRLLEVAQARARSARERIAASQHRIERQRQAQNAQKEPTEAEVKAAQVAAEEAEQGEMAANGHLTESEAIFASLEEARSQAYDALRMAKSHAAQIEARRSALAQLQARLGGQNRLRPWLAKHGLDAAPPIWQQMSIDPGFEVPVEAVLRERVAALRGGPNLNAGGMIDDAPPGRLALSLEALEVLPSSVQSAHDPGPPHVGTRLLSACIRSDEPQILALLRNWLHGYWVVESVELALEQREQLAPGHEFVTLAGHRISRFGVQFHHPDSEQDGLLARQNELTVLDSEWAEAKLRVDEEATRVEVAHQAHHSGQQALVLARDASRAAIRLASQNRQSADSLGQTRTRAVEAKRRIEAELLEAQSEADEQIKLAEAAEVEVAQTQTLRQQQTFDLERGRQATADSQAHLSQVKTALRALEHQDQETAFELREARARAARAEEQRASAAAELQRALEDVETQHQKLATLRADEANESLESARVRRDLAESALGAARAELDALSLVLRQIDGERLLQERGLDPIRARIQQHQLEEQAARLMLEQVLLQITEAQAESGAVVDEMALRARFNPPPAISYLQQEGTRLGRAIAALGSVNLAALDELNEARERTAFLESQSADLHQAMQTLEGAIRSIDRETRELLRETFDRVNGHFGRLFPLLFGGGEARLTLSGDEILDAGLHVTAQPPGKRNTSIQLLSGGEKAMTATALVFALFQLNPAPFCLLDEVDAALDDANTERYCRMVRTMADQTQFLFITHNRIAMEFAEQLIGVTMQERGVSRIVAVDLDTAERMAEAA
ncbi:MAG: chromosome segregation protein SMC [Betaproteobacteria bacterium]|nr:chromosome segregation protein SMC [Betaproteobacteria bacterium]